VRNNEAVRAVEGWVRREFRQYAVALRKLAYSQSHGVGEHALLQLSAQLSTAADRGLEEVFGSVGFKDPLAVPTATERKCPTIEEIRAVLPEWPDTAGIPWQMCPTCYVLYDPASSPRHDHSQQAWATEADPKCG
jgi:hypothetical protein